MTDTTHNCYIYVINIKQKQRWDFFFPVIERSMQVLCAVVFLWLALVGSTDASRMSGSLDSLREKLCTVKPLGSLPSSLHHQITSPIRRKLRKTRKNNRKM